MAWFPCSEMKGNREAENRENEKQLERELLYMQVLACLSELPM